MKFRELINKLHLIVGLASGAIVLVVALTGCIWAFEEEIRYFTQHERLFVTPQADAERVPVSRIIAAVKQAEPNVKISQIRLFGDPEKAVQVFTKEKQLLTVNPCTAQILDKHDQESDWLLTNLKLHRTLLLGEVGKKIVYWNAWLFGIMLLSGFMLWLPARLRNLRWSGIPASLTVKWNAKAAKRTYDLHSVLGFYAIPFLLLIVVTGIDMASHGDKKKEEPVVYAPLTDHAVLDRAVASVLRQDAFEVLRVNLPKDSLNPLRVSVSYPTAGLRKESSFSFDPATAQLLEANRHEDMTFTARFWKSDYELHTGRILGLFGKFLAFVVSLTAASLPITGFLIWRNKRYRQKSREVTARQKVLQ